MKNLLALVIGGALTMAFIQTGFAESETPCAHHQKHAMHHTGGPMMAHGPMQLLKELDLSSQQQAEVRSIMKAQKPMIETMDTEKMTLMQNLHQVVSQAVFDEQQAKALTDQMGKMVSEHALQKAKTGNQIYALLTPEQQTKFDQLIKEKMQKRSTLNEVGTSSGG